MSGAKKISQEYFDSIVAENINDFGMSQDEAIEDAINQLKSQGADLSIICKYSSAEQSQLLNALRTFNTLIESYDKSKEDEVVQCLNVMQEKFNKDLSFRCLVTKIQFEPNAYQIFMKYFDLMDKNVDLKDTLLASRFLSTFQSYLNQQTDVLNSTGLKLLINLLGTDQNKLNEKVLPLFMQCLSTSCQFNESNRQFYVENGLCENLLSLILKHKTNDAILCESCLLIRSLLLDDDLRVEFGQSHEHAKLIASKLNGLDILMQIANQSDLSEEALGSIMLTLSKLAVRNEFCQEISDKGGLKFVLNCLSEKHLTNQALLKSALGLLKSICNNDQVKFQATKLDSIELIKEILNKYISNSQICELACAALTTLLLRNSDATEKFYTAQVHMLVVRILNMHQSKPKLVKQCCLALRNSISRNKEYGEKLLELKIEDTLRQCLNQNDQKCYDEVKSVLRDLGCQVELKELWTGTGKNLNN